MKIKQIIARIIFTAAVAAGISAATIAIGAASYAYWVEVMAGNWWHMPLSALCALALWAVVIGIVGLVFWAIDNK